MIKLKKKAAILTGFFCFALLIITACKTAPPPRQSSSVFDGVLFQSERVPSGVVKLVNGQYREKGAGGSEIAVSLDDHMATGNINQKDAAAVILVTDTGSGEMYYDLFLLQKTSTGWINTDAVELGDRIKVKSLSIADDEIIAQFLGQGPYDRPCCSTLDMVYKYGVSGGRMVKKMDSSGCIAAPDLVGTLWKWRETYYKNDTYTQSPDPSLYTLKLQENGNISARADCNIAGGRYTVNGENISIHVAHSIMTVCPDESFSDQYLSDLNNVERYYFKDGKLYIVLKNDGGVMQFSS